MVTCSGCNDQHETWDRPSKETDEPDTSVLVCPQCGEEWCRDPSGARVRYREVPRRDLTAPKSGHLKVVQTPKKWE